MEEVIEIVKGNNILISGAVAIVVAIIIFKSISSKNKKVYEKNVIYIADFPGKNKELPTYSPFVLKVISILEYCNIRYEIDQTGNLGPNPRGTLPFIRYNDKFIYDSYFIIQWISKEFKNVNQKMEQSISIDGGDERDQAIDHITKRFIDEAFQYIAAYYRWAVPEFNEKIIGKALQGFENPIYRSIVHFVMNFTLIKKYKSRTGNLNLDEILSLSQSDLDSLSKLLGSKKFIFGDYLSMADISMFACLAQIYYIQVADTQIRSMFLEKQNLVKYVENVKSTIFSDEKWKLLKQ
ncbi:hypothetical protein ACTA71_005116 [Dictyostelium dimigraforme]